MQEQEKTLAANQRAEAQEKVQDAMKIPSLPMAC